MFWVVLLDFYFYKARHLKNILESVSALGKPFNSIGTGLEFFVALFLFMVVFTLFYALGQLINGASALILDRLIVKKLLKYPFELYLLRLKEPATKRDHEILRDAVLDSTYFIFCLNLIPVVALECVVTLFFFERHEFQIAPASYFGTQQLSYLSVACIVFLVYIHFGYPSRRRGSDALSQNEISDLDRLYRRHWVLVGLLTVLELLMMRLGLVAGILILPVLNVCIGIYDQRVRKQLKDNELAEKMKLEEDNKLPEDKEQRELEEQRELRKQREAEQKEATQRAKQLETAQRILDYLRSRFANPIYFAANMVGYGNFPSTSLIRMVRDEFVSEVEDKDFFWLTYLTVQNRNEGSSQTVYHFLAMYGMIRNLCNATAFAIVFSVGFFQMDWPNGHGAGVIVWTAILCGLMYALFVRYLYVYGPYFAKYLVRAAAYSRASRRVYLRTSRRALR